VRWLTADPRAREGQRWGLRRVRSVRATPRRACEREKGGGGWGGKVPSAAREGLQAMKPLNPSMSLQGYLAHEKTTTTQDPPSTLGIGLL